MKSQTTKYQIFLSSTYEDLKEERSNVVETILKMYHFPIGMEMFSADNDSQWNVIQSTIDTSDIYILILAHRYGSLTRKEKISFTQKEFNYALKRRNEGKLEILCFIKEQNTLTLVNKIESDQTKKEKLNKFIEEVKNIGLTVEWWKNTDELCKKIGIALSKSIHKLDSDKTIIQGWVRKQHAEYQIQVIRQFLLTSAQDFEILNDEIETYKIDKNGHCTIERERNQLCQNDVTHGFTKYIPDKKGTSNIIEAIDMETGLKLRHIINEEENGSLSYFILFDKVIKKGEITKYKTISFVENYLSNLVERGVGHIGIKPFAKTKYTNKKDILIFPNIKLFNKLTVVLIRKEVGKNINQKIKPNISNKYITFAINYGKLSNSSDILVELRL